MNIWLYCENSPGKSDPEHILLCRETVYKHLGSEAEIHLVTPKNISEYLPDLDERVYQVSLDENPHQPCLAIKAAFIGMFLLEKYGGLYLDSGIIALGGLEEVYKKIDEFGFVASRNKITNTGHISTGFLGGKSGNVFISRCADDLRRLLETKTSFKQDEVGAHIFNSIANGNLEQCYFFDQRRIQPVDAATADVVLKSRVGDASSAIDDTTLVFTLFHSLFEEGGFFHGANYDQLLNGESFLSLLFRYSLKKLRIILCCESLATGKGGAEKSLIALANYLDDHGYEIAIGYGLSEKRTFPAYEVNDSLSLYPFPSKEMNHLEYSLTVKKFSPDVFIIYYYNQFNLLHFLKVAYLLRVPVVTHEGTNPIFCFQNWNKRLKKPLEYSKWNRSVLYSGTAKNRFVLDDYLSSLSSSERLKAEAFPNPYVLPANQNNLLGSFLGRKRIINIGGLKINKNILPLLRSFEAIARIFPEWDLHIFGSIPENKGQGSYFNTVTQTLNELNLTDRVFIRGPIEDIYSEYSKSNLHIITSLSEGLPNCVAEAMIHGIPSIGYTECTGTNTIIEHNKNGLLVSSKDPIDLTNGMVKLMGNPELLKKFGDNCFKQREKFAENKIYPKWVNLIEAAAIKIQDSGQAGEDKSELKLHYERMRKKELATFNPIGSLPEKTRPSGKLRILFLLTNAPFLTPGTTGTYGIIEALAKRGDVDLRVISKSAKNNTTAGESANINIPVSFCNFHNDVDSIVAEVNQFSPDIIHFFRGGAGYSDIVWALKQGGTHAKFIMDIQSPVLENSGDVKEKIIQENSKVHLLADYILSLSEFTLRNNIPTVFTDYEIIPLGHRFPILPKKVCLERLFAKKFVYIGSLSRIRQVGMLVDFFERFSKESSENINLDIFGPTTGDIEILKTIARCNRVNYRGFLQQDLLSIELKKYDAGIAWVPNNNKFSGSPSSKSIEFAASGLIVFATATDAHIEYEEKHGFVFEKFDNTYDSFSRKMEKMLSRGVELERINHNSILAQNFTMSSIVEKKLLPVYAKVSGRA